jgi:hypothetical protein
MPITHTIDHERRTMSTIASGRVTLADILQHLTEERRAAGLSCAELIDGRTGSVAFSPADVRTVVDVLRDLGAKHSLGPTAVLVSTDYAFGMLRMLEMLVDDVCRIRPFRDPSDAERWLQNPTDAT